MNLTSIQMFCLVVEHGSISEAARRIFVSQPAVSRQIRVLEEYYGTLLFDRGEGKLRLTEAGKILYPYMKAILEDHEKGKAAIAAYLGNGNEEMTLGATLTIGEYLLPKMMRKMRIKMPDLRCFFQIGNTREMIDGLKEHSLDLALIEGKMEEDEDLHVERFADDELILIVSPDHPWTKEEGIEIERLREEKLILREKGSGTRNIVEEALDEMGVWDATRNALEIPNTQTIKGTVEAGLGVAFLSRLTVQRDLELGILKEVRIRDFHLTRSLWLVTPKQRFRKKSVDRFLKYLRIDIPEKGSFLHTLESL